MIRLLFDGLDPERWSALLGDLPDANLLQMWAYGDAKSRSGPWRVERALIADGERIIGGVQAAVRRIPIAGGGIAWINRGPLLFDSADNTTWCGVLAALQKYWVGERGMLLRIAPPLRDGATAAGTIPEGFHAAEFGRGLESARLDLLEPLDVLRRKLDQKWRHSLNKAERVNATVESGADASLFADCIADYSAMLRQKGFATSVTPRLLEELQAALPPQQKLWSVVAREESEIAAFAVIARYGRTAEYLAGSSSASGRKWNAGNLVLWRAISEMKGQGLHSFDVGGMDAERTPAGIYHFKAGLGATPYKLPDEIEAYGRGLRAFVVRRAVRRARRTIG